MTQDSQHHWGLARLELLLVLAVVAFLLQLFPPLSAVILTAIDIRNWPRSVWFAVTCLLLLSLLAVRFGPDVYKDYRQRRARSAAERTKKMAQERAKDERETLSKRLEAMKRRVY
jgi:hypothetical protein